MVHKRSFRSWQKYHPNFMTPEIVRLIETKDERIIEISRGTGLKNEEIFGVTEFRKGLTDFQNTDRGKMFHDFEEAKNYAERLR